MRAVLTAQRLLWKITQVQFVPEYIKNRLDVILITLQPLAVSVSYFAVARGVNFKDFIHVVQ